MAASDLLQAVLEGPGMPPPPGEVSNYVDPSNTVTLSTTVMILCLLSSTVAILLRMYTKLFLFHETHAEDYSVVLGWMLFVAYCGLTIKLVQEGAGVHQWNIRFKDLTPALYYTNVLSIVYGIITFFLKLSILLQYIRIFVPAGKKKNFMFIGCHTVIWLLLAFYVGATFFEIFPCNPREKFWKPIMPGTCRDINDANVSAAVINMISDYIILLLPQRVIWKLQMPLRRKLAISSVFLVGLFACVSSVMRLYYAVVLAQTGDATYYISVMGLWTYAEFAAAIVCSCLPSLSKFFQAVKPSVLSFSSRLRTATLVQSLVKSSSKNSKGSRDFSNSGDTWNESYDMPSGKNAYRSIGEHELRPDEGRYYNDKKVAVNSMAFTPAKYVTARGQREDV